MGKAQIARLPRTIAAPRLTFRRGNHFRYIASICGCRQRAMSWSFFPQERVQEKRAATERFRPDTGWKPYYVGLCQKSEKPRGTDCPQGSVYPPFTSEVPINGSGLGCWLIECVDPTLHPRLTFLLEVTPGCLLVLVENLLNLGELHRAKSSKLGLRRSERRSIAGNYSPITVCINILLQLQFGGQDSCQGRTSLAFHVLSDGFNLRLLVVGKIKFLPNPGVMMASVLMIPFSRARRRC